MASAESQEDSKETGGQLIESVMYGLLGSWFSGWAI